MNVTLTITVDHPEELPRVLLHLASAYGAPPSAVADPQTVHSETATRRGRPRKDSTPPEAPTAPAETVSTPAVVETPAPAPVAETPAPTPAPAAVTTEAPATVTKKDVQDALIAVVQKHGKAVCGAVCQAHGAPNLSALAESTYAAVYRDAKAVLAMDADKAKATYLAAA